MDLTCLQVSKRKGEKILYGIQKDEIFFYGLFEIEFSYVAQFDFFTFFYGFLRVNGIKFSVERPFYPYFLLVVYIRNMYFGLFSKFWFN